MKQGSRLNLRMTMTSLVGLVDVVQWSEKALLHATLATDVAIRELFWSL